MTSLVMAEKEDSPPRRQDRQVRRTEENNSCGENLYKDTSRERRCSDGTDRADVWLAERDGGSVARCPAAAVHGANGRVAGLEPTAGSVTAGLGGRYSSQGPARVTLGDHLRG